MTAKQIAEYIGATLVGEGGGEDIASFYAGDFLSRVMGRAPAGCGWLTVMNNINVAGVAVLAEVKAVILCEGVSPEALRDKCAAEGIALLATDKPLFECCALLSRI